MCLTIYPCLSLSVVSLYPHLYPEKNTELWDTRMKRADINPSKIRAAAHRAMALAALHADSSLTTRLARYNLHMSKARALASGRGGQ